VEFSLSSRTRLSITVTTCQVFILAPERPTVGRNYVRMTTVGHSPLFAVPSPRESILCKRGAAMLPSLRLFYPIEARVSHISRDFPRAKTSRNRVLRPARDPAVSRQEIKPAFGRPASVGGISNGAALMIRAV